MRAPLGASVALVCLAACGSSSSPADGGGPDGGAGTDASGMDATPGGGDAEPSPDVEPRLVAASRAGEIASLDLAPPWRVRSSDDLGATVFSLRCRAGRCFAVHPSPVDSVGVFSALDLTPLGTIPLAAGADPRDVAIVDGRTAVISQFGRAELIEVTLPGLTTSPIDLSSLADPDGIPDALMLASCGRRVYVQLQRIDRRGAQPVEAGARLAVIDLDRSGADRLVGSVPLRVPPQFDMTADCAGGHLYLAEPRPLMQGGSTYEDVDLAALTATELPIAGGAEAGGFALLRPDLGWLITHTEFGPGPSSHLNWFGPGPMQPTYNTFAAEHVDNVALDRETDRLFFPDPCTDALFPMCNQGIHIFVASTGAETSTQSVEVGFEPIEIEVAR